VDAQKENLSHRSIGGCRNFEQFIQSLLMGQLYMTPVCALLLFTSHMAKLSTTYHFKIPVDCHSPVAQLTMFIAVVCTVIMGLSRQMGNLVLNLFSLILKCTFKDSQGNLTEWQSFILKQIPAMVETVLSKWDLMFHPILQSVLINLILTWIYVVLHCWTRSSLMMDQCHSNQ